MTTTDWTSALAETASPKELSLGDGARVAVIGGGPAGSFFSYFLLVTAERVGIELKVDMYEPRDFSQPAPFGCNMCGGIISETLVQNLATEGVNLPPTIVQRGIESYHLHMDVGSVLIQTPLHEKRIAAVYRGSGPKGIKEIKWGSFDGHLQMLAVQQGARVIRERVSKVGWQDGRPQVGVRKSEMQPYELVAVATGVNSAAHRLFEGAGIDYEPPATTKTFIREYYLGEEGVQRFLGNSMHVFLLDIPRLEFAALIPKGDYMSLCLLGEDIDTELVQQFLQDEVVQACLPPDFEINDNACQCSPRINVRGVKKPYADRLVFVGDCAVTRLYKDGIGAAYRTGRAAATTAVLHGISAEDFEQHYEPICRKLSIDNQIGKTVFIATRQIQKRRFARRAVLDMTAHEQEEHTKHPRMSAMLWDMFTGSAPYRDVLVGTLHPGFWGPFLWANARALVSSGDPDSPSPAGGQDGIQ